MTAIDDVVNDVTTAFYCWWVITLTTLVCHDSIRHLVRQAHHRDRFQQNGHFTWASEYSTISQLWSSMHAVMHRGGIQNPRR